MNPDLVLQTTSVILTTVLGVMGIVIAIRPLGKEEKLLKWLYGFSLLIISVLLVRTNYWQASRNIKEQADIRIEAARQGRSLQEQNAGIQTKLDEVVDFINRPPRNFSSNQVASVVRSIALSSISNASLSAIANNLVTRIRPLSLSYRSQDEIYKESLAKTRDAETIKELQDKRNRLFVASEKDAETVLSDANLVRMEILRRTKLVTEEDKKFSVHFQNPQKYIETFNGESDADYLQRLANRLL
ncbi:MAG: hypothetical protein WAN24_12425 [Candidatus Acidiferrales bacterium]|jgi:hypothetical protein